MRQIHHSKMVVHRHRMDLIRYQFRLDEERYCQPPNLDRRRRRGILHKMDEMKLRVRVLQTFVVDCGDAEQEVVPGVGGEPVWMRSTDFTGEDQTEGVGWTE